MTATNRILKVYSCGDLAFGVRSVKGNFGIGTNRTARSSGWDEGIGNDGWVFRKKIMILKLNHT